MARSMRKVVACMVVIVAVAQVAAADIMLSTGLDGFDSLIVASGVDDAHWTVDQPGGGTAAATAIYPDCPNWYGPWLANGPASVWIAQNTGLTQPNAPYTFYRTFDLTGYDLASVSITGAWGIDDQGTLMLNGHQVSQISWGDGMYALKSFSVPQEYMNQGVNTLTITMDAANAYMDAVRLEGLVSVPEPITLSLVALSGLALARRRR